MSDNATNVIGYTWRGETLHQACLIERMIEAGELAPAARDSSIGDVLHQYESVNGGEVSLPVAIAPNGAACDRCHAALTCSPLLTRDEARAIARGWFSPDAEGLTAFATGHANATALLEDAIDEVGAIRTGHALGADLMRLSDYLTAQLPYFVVTTNVPGYSPEGDTYVARGVRAARQALLADLESAADHVAEAIPSPVLAMYDAHGHDVANSYATCAYDYERGDAVMDLDGTVDLLDELHQLDVASSVPDATLDADLADAARVPHIVHAVSIYAGRLVYSAAHRTRASLEADGWLFTADGEVDHDAMPY